MALKKISINEHATLLCRLDYLDIDEQQRQRLENNLKKSYGSYRDLLTQLEKAAAAYETAAKQIKGRRPLKKNDAGKYLVVSELVVS